MNPKNRTQFFWAGIFIPIYLPIAIIWYLFKKLLNIKYGYLLYLLISKKIKIMSKKTKETIIVIILVIACALSDNLFAQNQAFIGVGAGNKGVIYYAGISAALDIHFNYTMPYRSNTLPHVLSLSAGKKINITNMLSFTPLVGVGQVSYQDFTAYNADPLGHAAIEKVKKIKPIFTGEVKWGPVFLNLNYSTVFFAGVGILFSVEY